MADELNWTKLAAARLTAGRSQPFLAVALYALSPHPAVGLGTFAVDDRWRLAIDPARLEEWSVDEVAGVLLHEVGHLVRHHSDRARTSFVDEEHALWWNIAGDAEINDDLLRDGVVLPEGGVTPRTLQLPGGRAAEFYYARMLERMPPDLPRVACGEGATGHGASPPVGLRLPVGIAPGEGELLRRQVAAAIRSQAPGSVAAGWQRWADAMLDPVVDWKRLLAGAIRGGLAAAHSGRVDYSYSRPSRRRVPRTVLPALTAPAPTVAVVIDTSGSVSSDMLDRAWSETLAVLTAVGVRRERVRVWATDTVATAVNLRSRRVALVGGGGTDMRVGIVAALDFRPRPDLVIVLTDGFSPWPAASPGCPIVVGLLEAKGRDHLPPWVTVVDVPPGDAALLA